MTSARSASGSGRRGAGVGAGVAVGVGAHKATAVSRAVPVGASSSSSASPSSLSAFWGAAGAVKRQAAAYDNPSLSSGAAMMFEKRRAHTATTVAGAGAVGGVNADAAPTSSSTTDDALKDVQERLGLTLSEEPTVPPPHPAVIVISGPSGVGKDAVIRRLRELRPELHMVVTATSRGKRPGEVHGVDYFFVSTREFEDMIDQGELIEHAVVYGEYKGIPKQQAGRGWEDKHPRRAELALKKWLCSSRRIFFSFGFSPPRQLAYLTCRRERRAVGFLRRGAGEAGHEHGRGAAIGRAGCRHRARAHPQRHLCLSDG